MFRKTNDLFVCTDCYLQHECGHVDSPDPEWSRGAYEHAIRMLALGGHRVVSGEVERRIEFSRQRCDLCGSTLGGSRYHLAVITEVES